MHYPASEMISKIRLGRLFFIYCLVLVAMMLLIFLANMVPNRLIWDNVARSLPSKNYVWSPGALVQLDQFTECIAVTVGLTPRDVSIHPFIRAVGSPTLGPCEVAGKTLAEDSGDPNSYFYYWRYWHGYQVLSRPILALTDTKGLRLTVLLLVSASLLAFLTSVFKSLGAAYVYIFLISLLSAPLYSQFLLVSHSGVWIISLAFASFLLFVIREKPRFFETRCLELFFVVGMGTAYVDIFTDPLVTLTIPLLVLFWRGAWPITLNSRTAAATAFLLSSSWMFGYACCWSAKWALALAVLPSASLAEVAAKVFGRLSGTLSGLAPGQATSLNSIKVNFAQAQIGFAILSMAVAFRLLTMRDYAVREIPSIDRFATATWIVSLPIVWLALVRNHSVVHAFFVAPILIPSFALLLAALLPEDCRRTEQSCAKNSRSVEL
jgi:hypothetical protein